MSIQKKRQLAAILFADIVGYTSLMQQDEKDALAILNRFQTVLKETADDFSGEVIKSYGDGSLLLFPSTVNAVECAQDLQMAFEEAPIVPLRIGIHIGEFVRRGNDIFGNGVNIAARIESVGIAGSVLFSEDVAKRIKNHPEFETVCLGTFDFKNVAEEIEVFALTNDGMAVPQKKQAKTASIAVLPFEDMSALKDQEYFGDGMAEEILNTLAKVKELKVAGRTSSFYFKGKETTIAEIGKTLNVSHVLEGSVRKHGHKIRVTAQLIKVADGFHIWSEKYDRDFDDIFAIQDELAQSIGAILLEKLVPAQINKLKTNLPRNSKAYDLFLQGKHLHWHGYRSDGKNQKDFDQSEGLFLQAIQLDRTYALAYAGLADLYDTHIGTMRTKKDTIGEQKYMALSKQYSDIAFQLNPELSYINTVRGYSQIAQESYQEAFKSILKGIQLSPKNPEAIFGLQYFYRCIGLHFDAISIGNQLREIDPLFESGLTETLANNYRVGNVEQVVSDGQYLIGLKMDNTDALRYLFYNYFAANRKEAAQTIIEKINKTNTTYNTKLSGELTYALIQDNQIYIENTLQQGTSFDKFIIHNFYGTVDKAEKELKVVLAAAVNNDTTEKTIQNTDYLYYSKNKLFGTYQNKDWFQEAIAPMKTVYDTIKKEFPSGEEVLMQLNKY